MIQPAVFKALGATVILGLLTSCSQAKPESTTEKTTIGMANPASVYCLSLKGQLVSVNTAQGVSSDCVLRSGERIEEWALFRRDHP